MESVIELQANRSSQKYGCFTEDILSIFPSKRVDLDMERQAQEELSMCYPLL
jgi:hypothetical protein